MNSKSAGVQMKWFSALAGVFCLVLATGASAADGTKPCAADAAKLCNGVQPGGGALAKCLKEHSSDLSPACKDSMVKAKAKLKDFKQACSSDVKTLCKDAKRGGGGILRCLKQHDSELSASCKEVIDQPRG